MTNTTRVADEADQDDQTAGITIPRALAWAILTAAVTTALAITASLLGMTDSIVIIATGLATVAGCSILATVVILCCRGSIAALRRDMRACKADTADRQGAIRRDIAEASAHIDERLDDITKLMKKMAKDVRSESIDQLDRVRASLAQEIAAVRVHQAALMAESLSTSSPSQRRHLNSVE